jgi:hypothetical protein
VSEPATPGYEITRSEVTKFLYALGLDPREVVTLHICGPRAVATLTTGAVVSVRIKESRSPSTSAG